MITSANLYDFLVADTALNALIGNNVYPIQAPQNCSAPYIIYQRIATQPMATLGEATGNQFDLIQFSCFATTFEEVDSVGLALVAALDGAVVHANDNATLQSRRDGYEEAVELYRVDCDFLV